MAMVFVILGSALKINEDRESRHLIDFHTQEGIRQIGNVRADFRGIRKVG